MIIIRNANGYGGVIKLSGKRRKPYLARVTDTWVDVGGKNVQKYKNIGTYKTQPEANRALAAYHNSPENQSPQNASKASQKRSMTFTQLYDVWSARKFDPASIKPIAKSTKKSYRLSYNLCGSIKDMQIADIKKSHLEDIIKANKDHAETLVKLKMLLTQLYTFAIGEDLIDKNYAEALELPKAEKKIPRIPFTEDEIKTLWQYVGSHYLIDTILIMIYTGLGIGELCDINNANVHIDERYMVTGPEGKNDYRENRIIPLHDRILPLVQARYNASRAYLITNDNTGGKYEYQTYRDHWDMLMPQLDMIHLPHDCRHTFATRSKQCKMDDLCRIRIMGHSPKMLIDRTYTHTEIEELIREVNKLP